MAISAKDVQTLRERSGCGMMDCKNALVEANGDMDKAIEILREKGLAAQVKKAGRIAAEGLVYAKTEGNVTVLIEVNSETDFVAKNQKFVDFVDACADAAIKGNPADVEALMEVCPTGGDTLTAMLQNLILQIGENMKVRRFARLEGHVASYIHGGGRIGVLIEYDAPDAVAESDACKLAMKDVAMQVAAANAQYLNEEAVPTDVIENEKRILTIQAMTEGKPENIAQKMVAGRIQKFYKEVCLLDQPFVKDPDISVAKYVENVGKELGGTITIKGFVRYERGEGLEKRSDNFAEEVASMMK